MAMTNAARLTPDSPMVQTHLAMLQSVVQRLADNSASCKTWCVSLVSAIAVVGAESQRPNLILIAALPIVLFAMLDCYYLGLERRFRKCYDDFVRKLHHSTASIDDVFLIAPKQRVRGLFVEAFVAVGSFSIWPFYIGIGAVLGVLTRYL
jgi:hypothetical protein